MLITGFGIIDFFIIFGFSTICLVLLWQYIANKIDSSYHYILIGLLAIIYILVIRYNYIFSISAIKSSYEVDLTPIINMKVSEDLINIASLLRDYSFHRFEVMVSNEFDQRNNNKREDGLIEFIWCETGGITMDIRMFESKPFAQEEYYQDSYHVAYYGLMQEGTFANGQYTISYLNQQRTDTAGGLSLMNNYDAYLIIQKENIVIEIHGHGDSQEQASATINRFVQDLAEMLQKTKQDGVSSYSS